MRDYNTIPFRSPRTRNTNNDHSNSSNNNNISSRISSQNNNTVTQQHQQQQQQNMVADHPLVEPPAVVVSPIDYNELDRHGGGNGGENDENEEKKQEGSSHISGSTAASSSASFPRSQHENNNSNAKTSLLANKSDAVILELRSSVRQLRRQMEKLQSEKSALEQEHEDAMEQLQQQSQSPDDFSKDERVGELRTQLDRAHAQILTADMVRKELEDTLEAEQYTWELRVQDHERTIQQLQQECLTLSDDLNDCRKQWKDDQKSWTQELEQLRAQLKTAQQDMQHSRSMQDGNNDSNQEELKARLAEIEQERSELQGCLDEALKELEAVDIELQGDALRQENERLQRLVKQGDGEVLEGLQHLYRWLLERDGVDNHEHMTNTHDSKQLLKAIESHLELMASAPGAGNSKDFTEMRKYVSELESQLSVYRGDLKAREESSSELRASLKEAVALLKPLQDAVAKAETEKAEYQREIDTLKSKAAGDGGDEAKKMKVELAIKEQEILRLKQEIEDLELELSKSKMTVASSLISAHKAASEVSTPASLSKAREELKAKRATEHTLKQLLRDAQTRFHTLHTQNQEVSAMNHELQGRLKDAEVKLDPTTSGESTGDNIAQIPITIDSLQQQLNSRESRLHEVENELKVVRGELAQKDVELRDANVQVHEAKSASSQNVLEVQERKLKEFESKLAANQDELNKSKGSEKALKKSLREALGLLKPLQMHLEEAEKEKRELVAEIRNLRREQGGQHNVGSLGHTPPSDNKSFAVSSEAVAIRELEETVKHLELENSQLHDALEDVSQSINQSHISGAMSNGTSPQKTDSRLREEIVELQSRNEVTQARLQDAYGENHSLIESLNKRDQEEHAFMEEIQALREKLHKSQGELENAKFIATSALSKVEELTMAKVQELTLANAMLS